MWVYLCGLTRDFNAPEEVECRKVINQIGHEFSIKFLAIKSYKNHLILRAYTKIKKGLKSPLKLAIISQITKTIKGSNEAYIKFTLE